MPTGKARISGGHLGDKPPHCSKRREYMYKGLVQGVGDMLRSGYQLMGKKTFFDFFVCIYSILDAENRTIVHSVSCTKLSKYSFLL